MLTIVAVLLFSLVSGPVFANPFANNIPASGPNACPANHKMYFIGASAPESMPDFPVVSLPLNWTAGNSSRNFIFTETSGNKTFNINFSSIVDKNNSEGTPPFFGSITGSTSSAINLVHNSTSTVNNHVLNISTNRSVSKAGYKIQDVDSLISNVVVGSIFGFPIRANRTPYAEQVDVSANGGRLTFNSLFHTANNPAPNTSIVTAIEGQNCSTGECDIDASWGYKAANSVLGLRHNNTINQTSGPHAVGYSNFYFCLAPPKIIVNKLLDGNRVDGDDQFRIELRRTDNNAFVEAFTTTGSNDVVTDNTTTVTTLTEGVKYTVSEQIINGNLLDYQTTYTCSNATTGTDIILSSGTMPVNAAGTRRTFAINNVDYGDEITCNITNTPVNNYTFTGFVFNDNGGIAENNSTNLDTNTKSDISSTFTGNNNYFNGKFEREIEQGIYASGLQVRLTDCGADDGTNIAGTTAKNVSDATATLGQFKFTVPASALAGKSRVCLVQTEPSAWKDSGFSVDTTSNSREVTLVNGTLDYKTENDGSRNLDFGEVKANYASLVLIKSQHVNDCDINANYDGIFSASEIDGIEPGRCIAYKIDAYNRGHVDIRDVQITDELQQTPVKSVFHLPYPKGSSSSVYDNTGSLPMGTIVSKIFNLDKPTGTSATKATLYFNTKYGTTVDP